jgi:hypothetical protein
MLDLNDFKYLPVDEGNSLVLTESKTERRNGMDNDDDYYDELDLNRELVARYHVWHHMSIYPPQDVDEGLRKFDTEGKLIATGSKQVQK